MQCFSKNIVISLFFLVPVICLIAQENQEGHQLDASEKKHAISFMISHTHIKSGVDNETGDDWISSPSFAINYNYWITKKLGIGLHNDIIVEEFVINKNSENKSLTSSVNLKESEIDGIKRSHPIASALMLSYKPIEHLSLMVGGGMEFSKEENFSLVRLGLEAPFEIPGGWEIFGSFTFDINIDAYNSLAFGFGIAKLF